MIPFNPILFARAPAGTQWFDIFSFAPGSSGSLNVAVSGSWRQIVSNIPKGGTHLRAYMASALDGSTNQFKTSKVAVGKLITGTYSQPSTQAVPVEITFNGGQHGFGANTLSPPLNPGQMIESDEIAFAFTPSDKLVFIFDVLGSTISCAGGLGVPNSELWERGSASATLATVTGFINAGSLENAAGFIRIGAR